MFGDLCGSISSAFSSAWNAAASFVSNAWDSAAQFVSDNAPAIITGAAVVGGVALAVATDGIAVPFEEAAFGTEAAGAIGALGAATANYAPEISEFGQSFEQFMPELSYEAPTFESYAPSMFEYEAPAFENTISNQSSNFSIDLQMFASENSSTVGNGEGLGILEGKQINVTQTGLDIIENHLSQFEEYAPNSAMFGRVQNAFDNGEQIYGADASFYMHEISESTFMQNGLEQLEAHEAAFLKYDVSPFSVYHAEVINSYPELFNNNWRNFWGY